MTASAFRLARVQPVLGRPLIDDDERGGANVVVIGFELWETRVLVGSRSPGTPVAAGRGVLHRRRRHAQRVRIPRQSADLDTAANPPVGLLAGAATRCLRLCPAGPGFHVGQRPGGGRDPRPGGARWCGPPQRTTPTPGRPVCDGPAHPGRRQPLGRRRGPVPRGTATPPSLRKHRDPGLRAGRHATRGVRRALRARCNARPHRHSAVRRGARARGGCRSGWIPAGARARRADLEAHHAGHRSGERSLLVRFQSLVDDGALPGWTGCRRRRDRWRRSGRATDGPVAIRSSYIG